MAFTYLGVILPYMGVLLTSYSGVRLPYMGVLDPGVPYMGVLDPGVSYMGVPEGPCIGVRLYVDTLPPVLPAFITAILQDKLLIFRTFQVVTL